MTTFISSNGVSVRRSGGKTDRGYSILVDGNHVSPNDAQALREFFQHERDEESIIHVSNEALRTREGEA